MCVHPKQCEQRGVHMLVCVTTNTSSLVSVTPDGASGFYPGCIHIAMFDYRNVHSQAFVTPSSVHPSQSPEAAISSLCDLGSFAVQSEWHHEYVHLKLCDHRGDLTPASTAQECPHLFL